MKYTQSMIPVFRLIEDYGYISATLAKEYKYSKQRVDFPSLFAGLYVPTLDPRHIEAEANKLAATIRLMVRWGMLQEMRAPAMKHVPETPQYMLTHEGVRTFFTLGYDLPDNRNEVWDGWARYIREIYNPFDPVDVDIPGDADFDDVIDWCLDNDCAVVTNGTIDTLEVTMVPVEKKNYVKFKLRWGC